MILHRLETFCGELIQIADLHHIPFEDELFDFAVPVVGERDGLADVSQNSDLDVCQHVVFPGVERPTNARVPRSFLIGRARDIKRRSQAKERLTRLAVETIAKHEMRERNEHEKR